MMEDQGHCQRKAEGKGLCMEADWTGVRTARSRPRGPRGRRGRGAGALPQPALTGLRFLLPLGAGTQGSAGAPQGGGLAQDGESPGEDAECSSKTETAGRAGAGKTPCQRSSGVKKEARGLRNSLHSQQSGGRPRNKACGEDIGPACWEVH